MHTMNVCERIQTNFEATYIDKECQVEISLNSDRVSGTFTCNRYIRNSEFSDVEIQTDIIKSLEIKDAIHHKRLLLMKQLDQTSKMISLLLQKIFVVLIV